MLTLSNINVSYEGSRILRGVNLTVPEKSLVCLMGRNGVGKTTLFRMLTGQEKPDQGTIRVGETIQLSAD